MSDEDCYWWQSTYSIVKCLGCDDILFHKEDLDESDFETNEYGESEVIPRVTTYPGSKPIVEPLYDNWHLPSSIRSLYVQTFDCLNQANFQLAAAGFRAIIEAICRDKSIAGRNLETMINNLAKSHVITAKDRDHLHAIRFMGNDSIHCLKTYRETELIIVAHVLNATLTSLYLIEREVEDLDVAPISKFSDFIDFLESRLSERNSGDIDTLRGFIGHERRIISEDIPKFESELQTRINNGNFPLLSFHSTPSQGRPQQYRLYRT